MTFKDAVQVPVPADVAYSKSLLFSPISEPSVLFVRRGFAVGGITRGVSAERFETPLVGASRLVLAAWGFPCPTPAFPLGGNGKGGLCGNYFACFSSTAAMRV
jgi:hypothetical protein